MDPHHWGHNRKRVLHISSITCCLRDSHQSPPVVVPCRTLVLSMSFIPSCISAEGIRCLLPLLFSSLLFTSYTLCSRNWLKAICFSFYFGHFFGHFNQAIRLIYHLLLLLLFLSSLLFKCLPIIYLKKHISVLYLFPFPPFAFESTQTNRHVDEI